MLVGNLTLIDHQSFYLRTTLIKGSFQFEVLSLSNSKRRTDLGTLEVLFTSNIESVTFMVDLLLHVTSIKGSIESNKVTVSVSIFLKKGKNLILVKMKSPRGEGDDVPRIFKDPILIKANRDRQTDRQTDEREREKSEKYLQGMPGIQNVALLPSNE